jgi:oligopeptide/dipeptide ABC transporter ATP-binding protein
MGLKHAFPSTTDRDADLISIPGSPPELRGIADSCRFASRCPFATDDCRSISPQIESYGDSDHTAACIRIPELGADELRRRASDAPTWHKELPAGLDGSGDSPEWERGETEGSP